MLSDSNILFRFFSLTISIILLNIGGNVYAQSDKQSVDERIQSYLSEIASINQVNDDSKGFIYNTYQSFISSNDSNSCPFTPSCSAYAAESLKKHGLIKGIIKSGDRLQRCNGGPTLLKDYSIDFRTSRLADPVE